MEMTIRTENPNEAEVLEMLIMQNAELLKLAGVELDGVMICVSPGTSHEDKCKMMLINVLADYIIRQYEAKLVARVVESNYCYFNGPEKAEIRRLALGIVKNDEKNFLNSLFQIRRRNVIIRKLLDVVNYEDEFVVSGFVNFRLQDYLKDLEEIVDKAVDDFLMNKEYEEFIRLLRYFVDIQDPQCDVVYVRQKEDGKYEVLDDKGEDVQAKTVADFISDISDKDIDYGDFLVSSLITLAPRRIYMRGKFKNPEILTTIKRVFDKKVIVEEV